MKSRTLKTAVSILIFLILITVFALVSRPIYKGITSALEFYEEKYLNLLSDKTGLSLRYKSLSPSILTGIKLKNVEIYEKETGDSILKIRKINVKYDVSKLIDKDFENAFTKIIINDVSFAYDNMENQSIANHLKFLGKSNNEKDVSETVDIKGLSTPTEYLDYITNIIFMLPQDVLVKNITGAFKYNSYDVKAKLDTLSFLHDKDSDSVSTRLSGWVVSSLPFLSGDTAGVTFDINAHVFDSLEDSSIFVTLNDYGPADYSIKKMEFLARYSDYKVMLSSIQQFIPYNMNILFEFETSDVKVDLSTQDLDPFEMVKLPSITGFLSKIKGTRFTVDGVFDFNLNDYSYSWNAMGATSISRNITPDGEWVNFSANGNNDKINVEHLNAWGNMLQASLNGSFDLKTFSPTATLSVDHFRILNDNAFSFDAYLDCYNQDYTIFIPQLYIADKYFTAVQLNAVRNDDNWSFVFDSSDYSHMLNDSPGNINVEGNLLLGESKYLEAIVHVTNEFGDSIFDTIGLLLNSESAIRVMGNLSKYFHDFVVSTDLYLSSNMKSVTYNAPYVIVADTLREKRMAIVSLDGTDLDFNFSQLDIIYGPFALQGNGNYSYFKDISQHTFTLDATVNSIPYSLNGMMTEGNWLNITGNYGLEFALNLEKDLIASFSVDTMPVMIKDFLFYVGTNMTFFIEDKPGSMLENEFSFHFNNLEVQENGGKIDFQPKVTLSGDINNSGIFLSSLAYSDNQSSLSGDGNASWSFIDSSLREVNGKISLENTISREKIVLDGKYSQQPGVEGQTINRYIDLFTDITGINMGRFLSGQNEDDVLNAKLNITGSLSSPSIVLDLAKLTMNIAGSPLTIRGDMNLDMIDEQEWYLNASNVGIDWKGAYLSGLGGNLEVTSFDGALDGTLGVEFLGKTISMPMDIAISSLERGDGIIPESFMVVADSKGLSGNYYEEKVPFHLEVIKAPSVLMVRTDENLGLSGYYLMDSGSIQVGITEDKPLHFNLDGNLNRVENTMDISLGSFYFDISKFANFINTSKFSVYSGILQGDIELSGLQTDPEFSGFMHLNSFVFNLPDYVKDKFRLDDASVYFLDDEITLPATRVLSKDSGADISAKLSMDRWKLDSLDVKFTTFGEKGIPVDTKYALLRVKGRFDADVSLNLQDDTIGLTGDISANNTEISVLDYATVLSRDKNEKDDNDDNNGGSGWGIQADLNLQVGDKVQFIINPVVRGMVSPGTKVSIGLDTAEDLWSVKGDVVLRGGEVSYLSRNFYLKEGRIILDENQNNFDPMLTVRAETRERDDNGQNVTIIMSAVRQKLSMFNPTLYANPAKSEAEIYELLGQLAVADSSTVSGLLLAGVDYGVQMTVVRRAESALRDLFNFDIFSVRSSVLQNAIQQGLNGELGNNISFGNYFDNTTVYIGKYIGSSVYLDAMLLWTYDATTTSSSASDKRIVFKPEIGVEFAAPFADIRWSFAPDLGSLQETLVSGTSITLSWRINF